jgi:tripartite-type tricarboxylate transporter receptor subunit TctC
MAASGRCATFLSDSRKDKKMPTKIDRRRFLAAGSAAASMPFLSRSASTQVAWPSRNIRMVCSYPAGGQTDLLARAFGDYISRQVGKTVVIENKAGASGAIGAQDVARADPDGHTILCSISTTYVMNRAMIKNPGYDMDKDLTLVSVIPGAGLLLVANPKHNIKSLDDFVAFAKKSGKVNFGTYSAGSSPHMTINELNKQYGLNIEPIHYRGEAPMWTGLAEGSLDVAMGSYTAAQSVLQSNHGVTFAVHSKKVDAIPDIKTLPEQGATSKFFTVSGFSGWAVPKATPQPIVDRLSELCVAANNDPKVKEVLSTFVLEPAIGFKESNALYQRELPVWLDAAKSLGIEPA